MKLGLHILIEKPMTADSEEAKLLAKAVASYPKTFMINNSANFRESAARARRMIQSGKLGKLEHVSCYMMRERAMFDSSDPVLTPWTKAHASMVGNGMAWGQLSHTIAWVYMV